MESEPNSKSTKTDNSCCRVDTAKPKLTDAVGNQNVQNKKTPPGPSNSQNYQLNARPNRTPRRRHIAVIGDSMTKLINGRKLSKSCKVTLHSFPGATIQDLEDYVEPILKRKPNHIIIHAGTNNLHRDNPQTIKEKMSNVVSGIKQQHPTISITVLSIIHRNDKPLFEKVL